MKEVLLLCDDSPIFKRFIIYHINKSVILLAIFKTTPTLLENWEILNNELNVLKLEFEVNIMDNKASHNSSSI
jgi:hypothetical protein